MLLNTHIEYSIDYFDSNLCKSVLFKSNSIFKSEAF